MTPVAIVSVPSEYQSAPSVNHSVVVVAGVKHEPSKMNGVSYVKYVYIIMCPVFRPVFCQHFLQ